MSQPITKDELTDVKVFGRIYKPVDGVVTIPLTDGTAYEVRLITENLKRKDWYYETIRNGKRHITVDFSHLLYSLERLIEREEVALA